MTADLRYIKERAERINEHTETLASMIRERDEEIVDLLAENQRLRDENDRLHKRIQLLAHREAA